MSLDTKPTASEPVSTVDELAAYFRRAERASPRLLGLEHEKLLFTAAGEPVAYDGPRGIGAVLTSFERLGWTPFREHDGAPVIAMTRGSTTISLEPGGQVELSGAPFATAREAHAENLAHLEALGQIASALDLRVATIGYRPFGTPAQMPWMPKTRYRIMRQTLGTRGSHAFNMMLMTATGQVSLDWRDEADCARKMTASARTAPLLVALYANSPIAEGRDTGLASFRSRVWNDVDPARCGFFSAMVDGTFSYRAYTEWALDAPMLFVRRNGDYLSPGQTFRRFLADGFEGERARMSDWVDHLSTLFPEVRIKQVLEIRSADCNDAGLTGALGALMRGLLYDEQALGEALTLIPNLGLAGHLELHHAAQRDGLRARVGPLDVGELAKQLVNIAAAGLARVDPLDVPLLAPLQEIAASKRTRADAMRERFAKTPSLAAFVG